MDLDVAGKVIHYYDKIGVAVVKLEKDLKVGDRVKFARGDEGFEQMVESMQLDHKPVSEAKAGNEVAMKVNQEVKNGAFLYPVQ